MLLGKIDGDLAAMEANGKNLMAFIIFSEALWMTDIEIEVAFDERLLLSSWSLDELVLFDFPANELIKSFEEHEGTESSAKKSLSNRGPRSNKYELILGDDDDDEAIGLFMFSEKD